MGQRYVVQKLTRMAADQTGCLWMDVQTLDADDPGAALHAAVIRNPTHRIEATTYRVTEEALIVNVSINLEAVDVESSDA